LGNTEEKSNLVKVFLFLDKDNDGKINLEELTAGLSMIMDSGVAETEAARIINCFGKRCFGMLDLTSKNRIFIVSVFNFGNGQVQITDNNQPGNCI
jgi:Ca2+-binding EF-hand superfamily protein